jgi:hypothetical protein
MYDFEVFLGKELLRMVKVVLMRHLDFLVIFLDKDPCVIPTIRKHHEVVDRMNSLSMVSTTSQGDEQPCSRENGGVGFYG